MVSQPLARLAIDVQVPPQETAAAKPTTASNQIVLELTADGGYAINTQPVPKDQLDTQFHAIYDNRPAKLLFVKSSPDRTYQDVIDAMDIARGAGVQVIGFTPGESSRPQ
jgi:biopolymer transport protein ExbD